MDAFGRRVHSIVTHITVELRPFLRFDGAPLIELDVRNAQPLILAVAFQNPEFCATYLATAQHSVGIEDGAGSGAGQVVLDILRSVSEPEVQEYSHLCEDGQFYETLENGANGESREKIKRSVYRNVFFGKVHQRGPVSAVFERLWPGIYDALRQIKQDCGYRTVSKLLQRMESGIMIDRVCGRLVTEYSDIRFLTIHDSVLTVLEGGDTVRRLIKEEFERLGVRVQVKP